MTREVVLLALSASTVCCCPKHFCPFIFPSGLAPGASVAAGSDSCSGPTNRDELPAHHGIERRVSFRQLPSRAQPCALEWPCRQTALSGGVSEPVRTDRSDLARYRRHD